MCARTGDGSPVPLLNPHQTLQLPLPPTKAPYTSCASLSAQEYQVMTDIMLLQVAAENYTLEPEDPFWAWFQAMEPLSEAER